MRIVIVGSAKQPWEGDYNRLNEWRSVAKFINHSDIVVRFKRMRNQYNWWTGSKNDLLYTRLNGATAYKDSIKPTYHIGVRKPKKINAIFDDYPYDTPPNDTPDLKIPIDHTEQMLSRNNWSRDHFSRLDNSISEKCREILFSRSDQKLGPTLGFIAFVHLLHDPQFAKYQKYYAGFTFQGYRGHNWELERSIIEEWSNSGRLISVDRQFLKSRQ